MTLRTALASCLSFALVLSASASLAAEAPVFRAAKPIWPKGRTTEMNLLVGFRAEVRPPAQGNVVLRVAASTIYRARVNGAFAGHGPARAAHGFYRVDEWDITPALRPGANVVSLEVAGYNANSYYLLDQPSFLQAEVAAGERVLAATGAAATVTERGTRTAWAPPRSTPRSSTTGSRRCSASASSGPSSRSTASSQGSSGGSRRRRRRRPPWRRRPCPT
ncbi:MAG: hypothetical protein H6Q10_3114, partial [Acidobacteria bacterium]|nr:hypothetical protein [Acidobacteriota bacterium]